MSAAAIIADFPRWLGEAFGPGPQRPPAHALGLRDGAPMRLRWTGAGYEDERRAQAGDRDPLYLDEDQALTLRVEAPVEVALHGAGGARIEAARRCPFPLEDAACSLTPSPEAWTAAGAAWRLAAAPRARLDAIRAELVSAGAAPGPAFATMGTEALPLDRKRRRLFGPALAVVTAVILALAAGGAITGAARIEAAAEDRLSAARAALSRAEAEAAFAEQARDAATQPLRAAQAAGAALAAAPSAAETLAALAAALPDDAYASRLTIRPGQIEVEVVAPDAAAIATLLAAAPGFAAATLKTAARGGQSDGMQRAVLSITPEAIR